MRVIQDSDDESDGNLEDETPKPQVADTSATQHEPTKVALSGTGSTGASTRRRTLPSRKTYN
jgi:hypothetical protein